MSDKEQPIVVLSVSVFSCVFPAQANDGVTVDQTQSFYVGGECSCISSGVTIMINIPYLQMPMCSQLFWFNHCSIPFP